MIVRTDVGQEEEGLALHIREDLASVNAAGGMTTKSV